MVLLLRVVRILLLLVLAVVAVSLVVGVVRPETGVVEKVVLLGMIAGCIVAAVKISALALTLEGRLQR